MGYHNNRILTENEEHGWAGYIVKEARPLDLYDFTGELYRILPLKRGPPGTPTNPSKPPKKRYIGG